MAALRQLSLGGVGMGTKVRVLEIPHAAMERVSVCPIGLEMDEGIWSKTHETMQLQNLIYINL